MLAVTRPGERGGLTSGWGEDFLYILVEGEWLHQRCDAAFVRRLLVNEGVKGGLLVEWLPRTTGVSPVLQGRHSRDPGAPGWRQV